MERPFTLYNILIMVAQFDKNKTCPTTFELQYRIYLYYKITHSSETLI